jgi:hypothetical protein
MTHRVQWTYTKRTKFEWLGCGVAITNYEMCRQDRTEGLLLPNVFTLNVNVHCMRYVQTQHKRSVTCNSIL